MTDERKCERCGKYFNVDKNRLKFPHSIDARICNSCIAEWLVFFEKWNTTYTVKYPKKQNPTWEAFMSLLPDISKERVEFT